MNKKRAMMIASGKTEDVADLIIKLNKVIKGLGQSESVSVNKDLVHTVRIRMNGRDRKLLTRSAKINCRSFADEARHAIQEYYKRRGDA